MDNIIYINPHEITKISSISGGFLTRHNRIVAQNLILENNCLNGDWDIPIHRDLKKSISYRDYLLFKNNQPSIYNWQSLIQSIKEKGYITIHGYVEVALGRMGDYLLVDGRHRLIAAQELNIPTIPVKVIYKHPDINNLIIPKAIYERIVSKWNSDIIIYHTYETLQQRCELIKNHIPLLKDLNVLEIGANSGMMMWSIMQYAQSLIELEKQEKYFNQCQITKNELHKHNVQVFNKTLQTFSNSTEIQTINGLYASFVLYHLNDIEIDILQRMIFPKCKTVIIPNRQMERKSRINKYYLNRDIEIQKLLKNNCFKVTIDDTNKNGYSVIIGQK